jgi:hypothetical protein
MIINPIFSESDGWFLLSYTKGGARLLPESEPGPHDWYQPRERLWFCVLHGVRFAVVDVNPDCALSQVDGAWEREKVDGYREGHTETMEVTQEQWDKWAVFIESLRWREP